MQWRLKDQGLKLELIHVRCHIQPERPVAFHEFISSEISSASEIGNPNEACKTSAHEEDSDLDSMPELEDEIDLDTLEIPV